MKTFVYLSYDLGIKGDYEGLYRFLALKEARECGDSFAYFRDYEYERNFLSEIKQEIAASVVLDAKSRIYVIYRDRNSKTRGRFLIGARKQAPWAGFATVGGSESDL